MKSPEEIVHRMFDHDPFSQWLGIELLQIGKGVASLKLTVRADMLNGFEVLHGGISYSLADSALAFASNAHGLKSMSIETSISHTKPCKVGDVLTTHTIERSLSNRIGIYDIEIKNQHAEVVALFKGTVYRSDKEW